MLSASPTNRPPKTKADHRSRFEKYEWFKIRSLPGIDLLITYGIRRPWVMCPDTYVLTIGESSPDFWAEGNYQGRKYLMTLPGVAMLEPGEVYAVNYVSAPGNYKGLFVPTEILNSATEEVSGCNRGHPHFKTPATNRFDVLRMFQLLHASLRQGSELEQQCRFAECLEIMIKVCAEFPPVFPRFRKADFNGLRRVRDLLHEQFRQHVSLDQLASTAKLSRFQLVRHFEKEFGVSPHVYQTQLRLSRSRELLRKGMPTSEVAAEVGFFDQSHFNRHFKIAFGVTPGQYLKAPVLKA